jgi:putative DNA primase/helicase
LIAVTPQRGDETELKKEVTAAMVEGAGAISLANVVGSFDSKFIADATARACYERRILGVSGNTRLRAPIWAMTENNATITGDIPRRKIGIRLDSNHPHPEDRVFNKKDLPSWVRAQRGNLIHAVLTLVQHWIINQRPVPTNVAPLGSFETWTTVIGGILECANIKGFLTVRPSDVAPAANHEANVWRAFVGRWWLALDNDNKEKEVQVSYLLPIAKQIEGFRLGKSGDEKSEATTLGIRLRSKRDNVFEPIYGDEDQPPEKRPELLKIVYIAESRRLGGWKLKVAK